MVTSASPGQGSTAGGTTVTIAGKGFGTNAADVKVMLGNAKCRVVHVNYDTLSCITTKHVAANVTLNVSNKF